MARRSMTPAASSFGAPCTWERKPSSAYFPECVIPDFASWRLASTSWVLFPMDETMPIPVMTTRLMIASPFGCFFALCVGSRQGGALLEQPDLQVLGAIDNVAVHGKPPVGDTKHQLCAHHALDVDVVHNLADVRQHLTGEFQFAEPQGPAAPPAADPPEIEADHLPKCIQAEAAGPHRVVLEMTAEKPQVRLHVEFGTDQPLAIFPAGFTDFTDPVEHQHRRQRQLRVARPKHLPAAAGQKTLVFVPAAPIQHAW